MAKTDPAATARTYRDRIIPYFETLAGDITRSPEDREHYASLARQCRETAETWGRRALTKETTR